MNKSLSIHEILQIRESFGGRRFRDWLTDTNYNINEIANELCAATKVKFKNIRFVLTNIASLNPAIGLVVSAVDSFILDRILNGWHPNLYLDNKLRLVVDKAVKEQNKKVEDQLRMRYSQ